MSEELKPCPFCGSTNLNSGGDDKIVGTWCLDCEATGPNQYGRHEWHTRAKPVVKALEWNSAQSGMWKSGHYSVWHQWASDGKFHASVNTGERNYHKIGVGYASLDEAKAAAQADFARRVHACLDGYDD